MWNGVTVKTSRRRAFFWFTALLAAFEGVVSVGSALQGEWRDAAFFAVGAIVLLWFAAGLRKRPRRELGAAPSGCDVIWARGILTAAGIDPATTRISAVKVVREAEPRLSMLQALDLVKAVAAE
jgi:hypothetical protein